jgi:hypothetical protein
MSPPRRGCRDRLVMAIEASIGLHDSRVGCTNGTEPLREGIRLLVTRRARLRTGLVRENLSVSGGQVSRTDHAGMSCQPDHGQKRSQHGNDANLGDQYTTPVPSSLRLTCMS